MTHVHISTAPCRVCYANRRLASLSHRTKRVRTLDPASRPPDGRTAAQRLRLDLGSLKRWQSELARMEAT